MLSCSLPQAIGYYMSSVTDRNNTPIVAVISESSVHLVIFPFCSEKEKDLLLNAVCVPFRSLCDDVSDRSFAIATCFLVLLTHKTKGNDLLSPYTGVQSAIPKRLTDSVVHVSEMELKEDRIRKLEEELAEERSQKDDQIRKKDDQIRKMAEERSQKDDQIRKMAEEMKEMRQALQKSKRK